MRYSEGVSLFRVNVVASNPKDESMSTQPIEVLVDTGSELTWLPADQLSAIGIRARRKRTFMTATGDPVEREVGYAVLASEGYETIDEVPPSQGSSRKRHGCGRARARAHARRIGKPRAELLRRPGTTAGTRFSGSHWAQGGTRPSRRPPRRRRVIRETNHSGSRSGPSVSNRRAGRRAGRYLLRNPSPQHSSQATSVPVLQGAHQTARRDVVVTAQRWFC